MNRQNYLYAPEDEQRLMGIALDLFMKVPREMHSYTLEEMGNRWTRTLYGTSQFQMLPANLVVLSEILFLAGKNGWAYQPRKDNQEFQREMEQFKETYFLFQEKSLKIISDFSKAFPQFVEKKNAEAPRMHIFMPMYQFRRKRLKSDVLFVKNTDLGQRLEGWKSAIWLTGNNMHARIDIDLAFNQNLGAYKYERNDIKSFFR